MDSCGKITVLHFISMYTSRSGVGGVQGQITSALTGRIRRSGVFFSGTNKQNYYIIASPSKGGPMRSGLFGQADFVWKQPDYAFTVTPVLRLNVHYYPNDQIF